MAEVKYFPLSQPGVHAIVDMKATTNSAHVGDWLFFSGGTAISVSGARTGLGYIAHSGIGIALDQSPKWTNQGSAYHLTAMPVGGPGNIYRVTGHSAYTAVTWLQPTDGGSGQVGQTGRTGQAAIWSAANAPNFITGMGNATAAVSAYPNSAVAQVLRRATTGGADGVSAQLDVRIFPNLFGIYQV